MAKKLKAPIHRHITIKWPAKLPSSYKQHEFMKLIAKFNDGKCKKPKLHVYFESDSENRLGMVLHCIGGIVSITVWLVNCEKEAAKCC